jgi:hypothetical protein
MNGAASFQLGGLSAVTEFDVLKVTGNADLDGTLAATLINNFTPALGDSFSIITGGSGVFGQFSSTELPALNAGLSWQVLYDPNDVTLKVVPEPSTLILAALGGLALLAYRRQR